MSQIASYAGGYGTCVLGCKKVDLGNIKETKPDTKAKS